MPETALMRQNCAEGLSGGAANGCYGKCDLPNVQKESYTAYKIFSC